MVAGLDAVGPVHVPGRVRPRVIGDASAPVDGDSVSSPQTTTMAQPLPFITPRSAAFRYVLVTAARNEAEYIELTIQSVVAQTLRPVKWMIVSDGSTDATDEIVEKWAAANPWIELVKM